MCFTIQNDEFSASATHIGIRKACHESSQTIAIQALADIGEEQDLPTSESNSLVQSLGLASFRRSDKFDTDELTRYIFGCIGGSIRNNNDLQSVQRIVQIENGVQLLP